MATVADVAMVAHAERTDDIVSLHHNFFNKSNYSVLVWFLMHVRWLRRNVASLLSKSPLATLSCLHAQTHLKERYEIKHTEPQNTTSNVHYVKSNIHTICA